MIQNVFSCPQLLYCSFVYRPFRQGRIEVVANGAHPKANHSLGLYFRQYVYSTWQAIGCGGATLRVSAVLATKASSQRMSCV